MERSKIDRFYLYAAVLGSVGSIVAFMIFYLDKNRINIFDKESWFILEPLLFIGGTLVPVLLTYFTALSLKRKEKTVFIIYSHADNSIALKLEEHLKYFGIRVLKDYQVIKIGDNISSTIKKSIESNNKIIVLFSKNSLNSSWVLSEIDYAISLEKRIFPVLIEDVEIPEKFKDIKFGDLRKINTSTVEPLYYAITN